MQRNFCEIRPGRLWCARTCRLYLSLAACLRWPCTGVLFLRGLRKDKKKSHQSLEDGNQISFWTTGEEHLNTFKLYYRLYEYNHRVHEQDILNYLSRMFYAQHTVYN